MHLYEWVTTRRGIDWARNGSQIQEWSHAVGGNPVPDVLLTLIVACSIDNVSADRQRQVQVLQGHSGGEQAPGAFLTLIVACSIDNMSADGQQQVQIFQGTFILMVREPKTFSSLSVKQINTQQHLGASPCGVHICESASRAPPPHTFTPSPCAFPVCCPPSVSPIPTLTSTCCPFSPKPHQHLLVAVYAHLSSVAERFT